jgi:hypothetical protein
MKTRRVILILAFAALTACAAGHDADLSHDTVEAETWAVTAWGEHFELFPEIDALVVNETADSHVHVTILDGFKAAPGGTVTVILSGAGGVEERFSSSAAVRPGIFKVDIQPNAPGERKLHFEVDQFIERAMQTLSAEGKAALPDAMTLLQSARKRFEE